MNATRTHFSTLFIGLGLVGCSDATSLDDIDHVRTWANSASAVGVYTHIYEPIALADGERDFDDAACPMVSDDGITMTITGGCFDSAGDEWVGSATIVRSAESDRTLTANGYGRIANPDLPATISGEVEIRRLGDASHEFDVDLDIEGVLTTRYDYSGEVAGTYGERTTWNGSGFATRDGLGSATGTIVARTVDQVLDDSVCSGQAVSGETTLEASDGHSATITYDGATDCDEERAAAWSLDGEAQGRITGITCAAASPGSRRGATTFFAQIALLFGVCIFRSRRRTD